MTLFFKRLAAFREAARQGNQSWLFKLRWLDRWARSQRKGANSMRDESPWITFGAIEHLERHLSALGGKGRVFEWGSGGSTLFFAKRAAEVIAVENDREWCDSVAQACAEKKHAHVTLVFHGADETAAPAQFDPSNPETFHSGSSVQNGHKFQTYAEHINQYADGSFDVVVVDGRARPACLRLGMAKVKPGGLLVLDNAERPWYQRARALVDGAGWKKTVHAGPGPYNRYFWETVVWQRSI